MSSWNPNDSGSDSDSGDEFDGPNAFSGREATVFLVDAYLYETQDRFQETLDLIRNALLSGLLTRQKDLIAVVFTNTTHSPEPKDSAGRANVVLAQNTAVLLPLKQLSKDSMDYYLNFSSPDYFDFANRYGTCEGSFANTIRLCGNMFKQCGFKLSTMTIVYFTDRECPHSPTSSEFQKAMLKAKDLNETDVEFNVVPMIDEFDYSKFYKEFICMVRDVDLDGFADPNPDMERKLVSNRQLRQDFQKRCQAHLKWTLGEGMEISTCFYNYHRKTVYPRSVTILREDNAVVDVKRVTKIGVVEPETNAVRNERYMKPGDELQVLTVGGQRITFTCDEVAKMRSPFPPGLKLLGFTDQSAISVHNFVKSPSFLYPEDNAISGSTKLFRGLWEKCIAKEKAAICILVARRKSAPRFVALIPSVADNDPVTGVIRNDGFRIVFLPSEDNYRHLNLKSWGTSTAPEQGVELFKKIVKKLKLKYAPTMIRDPFFDLLQSEIIRLAFDIETEGAGECGLPDADVQDARIASYIDDLVQTFGKDLEIAQKRKTTGEGGNASKTVKITDDQVSRETVDQLIANNALTSLNMKQLRNYLVKNEVATTSKATKALLIEKVLELHA